MKTLTPEQIKERLQEVGMTQKQLAEKLKMQPARLSEMINGKREMPEEVEEKIVDSLGTTAYEFPNVRVKKKSAHYPGRPPFKYQQLIDLIQSRRYLGLRHKKRLIEDLKGLEL